MNRSLWPRTRQPVPLRTHFLLVDHGSGIGIAFSEAVPGLSLAGAIELIPEYERVIAVFCADEDEGTWRDVTSDVVDELAKKDWDDLGRAAQDLCISHGKAPEEDEEDDTLDGHAHQRREAALMGHFR